MVTTNEQEQQGLIGCPFDTMCNANGPRTPGLRWLLAVNATSDIAFRNAQTLGRIQQLQYFGATSIHGCGATHRPFVLVTFLCTLQSKHFRSPTLIDTLQHSILGAWLTPTQAGVTPASQTDLANPHVHHIVVGVVNHWKRFDEPNI